MKSSLSPQKFREIVFQLIYSQDFGGDGGVIEMLMAQLCVTKKTVRLADAFKEKFLERKAEVDVLLVQHSKSYGLERIPRVERNILRLGIYELLWCKEVPPKVVISEAMRLARKFATAEAANFVNALMDSVYQSLGEKGDVSMCVFEPV